MIEEFRRFNRDFTVRLELLSRHRFDSQFSLAEARVLLEVGAAPRCSHSDLLRILEIDQGYLSRIIARLIELGLVSTRRREEDSRVRELQLTADGEKELLAIHAKSDLQIEQILIYQDESSRAQLGSLLGESARVLGRILPNGIRLHWVTSKHAMSVVAQMFEEYQSELKVDLSFQGFKQELAGLPGAYAAPHGGLLLATDRNLPVGCFALRALAEGSCELKRLYVRKAWRRQGVASSLVDEALREAGRLGYAVARLDTLKSWKSACLLYEKMGFRQIKPYYDNPLPDPVFYEIETKAKK